MSAYLQLTSRMALQPKRGAADPAPGDLPSRTAWGSGAQERLWAAIVVGIRAIPDEGLWCEIQIPRPRYRAVASADTTE